MCDSLLRILEDRYMLGMDAQHTGDMIVKNNLYVEAFEISSFAEHQLAFRAAWSLEWAYFAYPEKFIPYGNELTEKFITTKDPSVQRHYSKILCNMLRNKTVDPSRQQKESIAEKCFDLLINPKTKAAVKVWMMEILYDLSADILWVGEQLRETIEHQTAIGSPAIAIRGSILLKKIK